MSNRLFPIGLPGEGWPVKLKPGFSTIRKVSVSGRQVRIANYPFPLSRWEIPFNVLQMNRGDFATLYGHFVSSIGPWDSFLLYDPNDYFTEANAQNEGKSPITGQNYIPNPNGSFPAGDGTTTQFQLYRTIGAASVPVYNINGITATFAPPIASPFAIVYVNGTPVSSSGWSISATGLLTFTSAPAAAATVAVDFSYFWRVSYSEDSLDFENFVSGLTDCKSVRLEQVWG